MTEIFPQVKNVSRSQNKNGNHQKNSFCTFKHSCLYCVSQMRRTLVTRTNCTQQQTLTWHT